MAPEVSIDPITGVVRIGDLGTLSPWQDKASVNALLHSFASGSRDHGNGYEWLNFKHFSFGSHACALALCFLNGRLEAVHWSAVISEVPKDPDWPTRELIDSEVKLVSAVLDKQLGHNWRRESFAWGRVWSCFDEKGFLASNGLRYEQNII